MKKIFLEFLLQAESLPCFKDNDQLDLSFLKALTGFSGAIVRVYSGKFDGSWQIFSSDPLMRKHSDLIYDFSRRFGAAECDEPECLQQFTIADKLHLVYLSPFMVEDCHLGDLALVQCPEATTDFAAMLEWQMFTDMLAGIICARYQFADHVLPRIGNDSDRFLSMMREIQQILTANQRVVALTIEQEQVQAKEWFKEDQPILTRFMSKVKNELNLHSLFILQKAGPNFFHELIMSSASSETDIPAEIDTMIEEVKHYDRLAEQAISSRCVQLADTDPERKENLISMVFSCQAGGLTFGHLGIFTTRNNLARYLNHRSKILPMLANQLGFYFSHLFQLRNEAIEARLLQQINQTCNTINSSVDFEAILFKLVESLNDLFRQYSGAIVINSIETQELEVKAQLGIPGPDKFDIRNVLHEHRQIIDLINEGAVFDNREGKYPLPIRYILPLSATPQAQIISTQLLAPRSLGAVVLYEHPDNRQLSESLLKKMMPILLNGVGASLQVARNYAEKLETIKALEGLMAKLSNTDELLDEMIAIIRNLLRVNRISFLTLDESEQFLFIKKEYGLPPGIKETTRIPLGDEISGYVAMNGKSIRIDNIELEGTFKKRSMEHYLNRSLLSVPLISKRSEHEQKVIGVINVNNKTNGLTFTMQDQQLLEAIAHLVVTALEKVRFLEEKHEKDLLDRQLKDAKDIQMSLMPKSFSDFPASLEIYGRSIPARQIGGDFFDILNLDDGRVLIALGDVSGKGMPAAILMAVSRMILRAVVQDSSELTAILDKVNRKLSQELDSYHFVTLQIVAIDPITGKAEMSSAGHGPLMVRLSGQTQLIETKGGPPLGIPGLSVTYDRREFTMQASDSLIMYTDGLSEEHSRSGEMFGTARIERCLSDLADRGAKEITDNMIRQAILWREGQEAHDDLTILTMKYRGLADESK